MDDFYDELILLLNETNPMDACYSIEPYFSVAPEPVPSPVMEAAVTPMESPIPVDQVEPPNLPTDAANLPPAPFTHDHRFTFMQPPTLSSDSTLNNPVVTAIGHLGFGSMGPFPTGNLPTMTGEGLYHLQGEGPPQQQPFNPNPESNFGLVGNPMDPNWEAIASFLAGHVRPGPDVPRVYKCSICYVEFPNAQAFGGHMSSHSKIKRRERPSVAAESKKASRNAKANRVAKKGRAAGPSSNAVKGAKNKKKVEEKAAEDGAGKEKPGCATDEPENCEVLI